MARVCVIGAGSSGIAACQVLTSRGIDFDCYEAGSQVGGNWRYLNDNGMSSSYKSLHINTSRQIMEYKSFPMSDEYPTYPNHVQIARYFDSYVDHFGFRDRIHFGTKVTKVAPAAQGGWDVTVRTRHTNRDTGPGIGSSPDSGSSDSDSPDSRSSDSGTPDSGSPDNGSPDSGSPDSVSSRGSDGTFVGGQFSDGGGSTHHYEAVIVANGHHWDARWPEPAFPGADTFTGVQTHSHDYKTFDDYIGKRVLVLGIGNSACDIAVETSKVSERTFLAMRRGAHVLPKYIFGVPTDHLTTSPIARLKTPLWLQRLTFGTLIRLSRGDVTKYGLPEPDHKLLEAHPTISDDLLTRLGHGDITIKPNIERIDGDSVHFVDGTTEKIDRIVYCTGYKITFPFLDESIITARDNEIGLYHRVVEPAHEGLYFIGLVQPLGAIMPLAEAQSEWIADLLDGTATLPAEAEMRAEIRDYQSEMHKRYVRSKRHTIQVDFLEHLREIDHERTAGKQRHGQSRQLRDQDVLSTIG